MMAGGFAMFGVTYLATAIVGAGIYDTCKYPGYHAGIADCRAFGSWLMIPIAGPFGAMTQTTTATGRIMLLFPFATQFTGLALGIAGVVRFSRSRRESRMTAYGVRVAKDLHLNVGASSVGLTYRF